MTDQLPRSWMEIRRTWVELTAYQRFETLVAFLLRFIIAAVIVVAFYRLVVRVVDTVLLRALDPLEHVVFQQVFGSIMTLLIALEFSHTLQYVITRGLGIIQARIVVLIAILALARKIIITDLFEVPPEAVAALAALTLALGVTYWLMRHRDEHLQAAKASGGRQPTGRKPI